jgi:hypothetical protein
MGPGMQVAEGCVSGGFPSARKSGEGTLRSLPGVLKTGVPHRKLACHHVAQCIAGVRTGRIGLVDVVERVSTRVSPPMHSLEIPESAACSEGQSTVGGRRPDFAASRSRSSPGLGPAGSTSQRGTPSRPPVLRKIRLSKHFRVKPTSLLLPSGSFAAPLRPFTRAVKRS